MREKQREETRRRLYLAALEVFRRDGVAACRIDDIAQKAEVSRAAFYFHFPTKEHVLVDFLAESEAPTVERLNALPPGAPFEQVLSTCAEGLAAFWKHEAKLLVDALTTSLKVTTVLEDRDSGAVRAFMANRFRELAGRGELVTAVPPEVLSDFFISYMLVALISWAGAPTTSLEQTLEASMQLFLHGARPSTPMAAGLKKK
ncbi:MAG: TetR/AcrR family transcriptional regulator [Myxococcaceae bacterium]|jgi:AcrR family transcriptional regulator|nr:TetR/AcrR family transcriptional regulator [Myxococcaceae bacterium]